MNAFILVGAGGALGAMGRYGVGILVGRMGITGFPLATIIVNLLGSLVMGLFVGALVKLLPSWQNEARLFVAVGLLGGFTTFSAFSLDVITLMERGQATQALFYVSVSVIVGILGLFGGLLFMRGLPL